MLTFHSDKTSLRQANGDPCVTFAYCAGYAVEDIGVNVVVSVLRGFDGENAASG